MIERKDLYVGKQVVFDDGNRAPEYGFVTSWGGTSVFCRFWSISFEAGENSQMRMDLRTVANSEACSFADLRAEDYMSKADMERTLEILRSDPEKYGWSEQGKPNWDNLKKVVDILADFGESEEGNNG